MTWNLSQKLLMHQEDLLLVFRSPLVNAGKKVAILNALFQKSVTDLTLKFLVLITRKGRIVCLDEIADTYLKMYKKHLNITTVNIQSATSLDSATKEKIKTLMSSHTGATIDLMSSVNPGLIGGFRLLFEDYMYDASLKQRFVQMKKEFEKNIYERKF